jgi:hypothetical protein
MSAGTIFLLGIIAVVSNFILLELGMFCFAFGITTLFIPKIVWDRARRDNLYQKILFQEYYVRYGKWVWLGVNAIVIVIYIAFTF